MNNNKRKFMRLSIDVPYEKHMQLKSLLALEGKSMRSMVLEAMYEKIEELALKNTTFEEGENDKDDL